ncbi:MAG: T9SS type A sorting domain-containing protein [Bacteroidetes bacterium]|nr:T9SS type A sorting domain-containing protein [Bacteroidota bacterium]
MKTLLFLFVMGFYMVCFAQTKPVHSFDPSNAREGERVEYCHQHKKMAALMQNPAYLQQRVIDSLDELHGASKPMTKGTVYKIPVVFHVLHNNGPENISDEQILDALSILNRDFRLLNQDANNVQAEFQGMPADIEVEFLIATKAPNGQCFKGITRTVNALTDNGEDGGDQVDAIVDGNDVYNGSWPGNRYLNIFICGDIGGAAGYTTKPSGWSATQMTNGIWILHDYVGSIGTSSVGSSRTLTHEVGHWLNLDHTWGPNNNPGNASSCSTDDNVQDTPNCIGVQACIFASNTCNSDNAYWGFDIKDNVENYMDYSYCSKMFTSGQRTRMRNALQSNNTGRANVISQANLTLVGAGATPYLCKADFSSNLTTVCVGDPIQFSDESYNSVNSWSWSFPGGLPASASSQNPTVTYNTPGLYSVTLEASDGVITDSEIKNNYIRVLLAPTTTPFYDGFENYNALNNLVNWEVVNPDGNNEFTIDNTTSFNGIKCAKLQNFGQAAGSRDELISTPIDLSGLAANQAVTLSFRYAYRKKLAADNEALKVFITGDCGDTWVQRKTITGNQLSNQAVATSWKPSSQADWVTVHMTNITSTYYQQNFRAKWRFEGNGGNNFYLDDINLYNGAPSNTVVLGMETLEENVSEVVLYPNPVSSELNVEYTVTTADKMTVVLLDANGKQVQAHEIHSNAGKNVVMLDTHALAAGKYSATIYGTQGQVSRTFIKQ